MGGASGGELSAGTLFSPPYSHPLYYIGAMIRAELRSVSFLSVLDSTLAGTSSRAPCQAGPSAAS